MFKLLTFSGYDRSGPHIFPIESDVDQSIGHIKMARELPPEIEQYIRNAKPIPGKTQLLIDAMGAGEYYGNNSNGDYFPEEALSHKGSDYGYETFMHYAYPFRHHVNKDPARSYGDKVTLSAYDPKMHRILLIVSVDDGKCRDILGDLANNVYHDVSMGCRVPFDICTVCKNQARNRSEYCPHLRYQMNKILPDGRRVGAINSKPKFFDISFVTIGAEKASHVLKKVAHEQLMHGSSAELGESYYAKLSSALKSAEQDKNADIDKEVPSQPPATIQGATPEDKAKIVSFMDDAGDTKTMEPEIPPRVLDGISSFPMEAIFSTLSALGISLKPQEFQRIVLVKQGAKALADKLASHRLVFNERDTGPVPKWASGMGSFNPSAINEKIAMAVQPYMADRCCYPEALFNRLSRMEKSAEKSIVDQVRNNQWIPMDEEQKRLSSGQSGLVPASVALASGFMVFKKIFPDLVMSGPGPIKALGKHPWLLPLLIGAGVGASVGLSHMTEPMPLTAHGTGRGLDGKNSSNYHGAKTAALAYMHAGIKQRQWEKTARIKLLSRLVARHPDLQTIGSSVTFDLQKLGAMPMDLAIVQTVRRVAAKGSR